MKLKPASLAAPLLCAGSALFLVACGGSSSPESDPLTGAVIDGYIEGAKVCLDLNANGACDADEPSANTDASGRYRLDTRGMAVAGMNLVAEVPASAKDSDDGGQTLVAAGKSAFTLAAPVDRPSVITPLTTLIVARMQAAAQSLSQATTQVLTQLGLPVSTDPHADHVAAGNLLVGSAARQVASQLQGLQAAQGPGLSGADLWSRVQKLRQTQDQLLGTVSKPQVALAKTPPTLAQVANGQVFSYRMTSARGQSIQASAMLFTPKNLSAAAPRPLIVFGHGTVGVAPQCAPSVTTAATGQWEYDVLVAALVAQGYVVVAPDYEGLGSAEMGVNPGHPYLDLRSAGQSMALAAVAAKRILTHQLTGAWAAFGHSQGGHAALAGAQFSDLASQLEPSLQYKGTVAVAPASNLLLTVNTQWAAINAASTPGALLQAYGATALVNGYGAYLVKGTQSTPQPLAPASLLGGSLLSLYNSLDAVCRDEFSLAVSASVATYARTSGASPTNYPGLQVAALNAPAVSARVAANEPAQVRLPGKTLIVQGDKDVTVLPLASQTLDARMRALGSDVTYKLLSDATATHTGVLVLSAALDTMWKHLGSVFSPAAPAN